MISQTKLNFFLENYQRKNAIILFLKILITFGIYLIPWFYWTNKSFEEIDEHAPNSKRGFFVLFILPTFMYGTTIIIEKIILIKQEQSIISIKMLGWIIISFLILQYIYDFTKSFSRITKQPALPFYLSFYIGILGSILYIFKINLGLVFLIFPLFTAPAIQEIINLMAFKIQKKEQKTRFNYMERSLETKK